jgi:hypothetical protein
MDTNIGSQFVWWTGVVESRQDPKKVGRCRVRIVGSHTDLKSVIPTADLPWAHPLIPLNDNASLQIKEGDYVVGFYLDGQDSQVPIIMGILPGIPVALPAATEGFADPRTGAELSSAPRQPGASRGVRYPSRLNESTLSRLARNEKISQTPIQSKKTGVARAVPTAGPGTWSEPATDYAAVYPYNRVMETESGHILEFDDTPGAERIHIYHRSGTFEEVQADGTKVTRIKADAYEVVVGEKNIYINGDCNITAQNDINIKAGMNVKIEAGANIILNATGAITTQGALQSHTAAGPMSLTGIPMNLNGPPGVILPPPLPVVVVLV